MVRNSLLEQYDEPVANRSGPGFWALKNGQRLLENSRIRPDRVTVTCPLLNAGGTVLLAKAMRSVTSGVEREIRVRLKVRESDGIVGVVFGFQSITNYYRVLLRETDNCFAIDRVVDANTTVVVAQTNRVPSAILSDGVELRVKYGANSVSARLYDITLFTKLTAEISPTATQLPDASALGGDTGFVSAFE